MAAQYGQIPGHGKPTVVTTGRQRTTTGRSTAPFPLEFVIAGGHRAGETLFMENASTGTTIEDVILWLSLQSASKEEDVVSFFFGDFGKSPYFPIHEKTYEGSRGREWNTRVCDLLLDGGPIPILMKTCNWKSGYGPKKTTIGLSVSITDIEVLCETKSDSFIFVKMLTDQTFYSTIQGFLTQSRT